jgi:hypothetical protein
MHCLVHKSASIIAAKKSKQKRGKVGCLEESTFTNRHTYVYLEKKKQDAHHQSRKAPAPGSRRFGEVLDAHQSPHVGVGREMRNGLPTTASNYPSKQTMPNKRCQMQKSQLLDVILACH